MARIVRIIPVVKKYGERYIEDCPIHDKPFPLENYKFSKCRSSAFIDSEGHCPHNSLTKVDNYLLEKHNYKGPKSPTGRYQMCYFEKEDLMDPLFEED